MHFKEICFEKQKDYNNFLRRSGMNLSDYSFVNLMAWHHFYGLKWAMEDEIIWIKQTQPEMVYWSPVTDLETVQWDRQFNKIKLQKNDKIIRVDERTVRHIEENSSYEFEIIESRDQWDYLYSVKELIELKGKKFHKKKNLYNQFLNYNFDYFHIEDSSLKSIEKMQKKWYESHQKRATESLKGENRAILEVLKNWHRFENILGGFIEIDSEVAAFTIAENYNNESLIIHFEKGLEEYKGVYQAINRLFLQKHPNFKIVNREQDLGEPGLRKSKLAYNPVDYNRKYEMICK